MLLRLTIENLFSFGKRKEFNLFPYTRLNTLKHHCYEKLDTKVLKMAALYGANGAGKSNLVKVIHGLKRLIIEGSLPLSLQEASFKLYPVGAEQPKSQLIAIEFIMEEKAFYYGVEFKKGILLTEELYLSGLGKKEDELLFERKTTEDKTTSITLAKHIEEDEKGKLLKEILLEEFAKPNQSIMKWLADRESALFANIKKAWQWFDDYLYILAPDSKPHGLASHLQNRPSFKQYADEMMASFKTGVNSIEVESVQLEEFFGQDEADDVLNSMKEAIGENKGASLVNDQGDELVISREEENFFVKLLKTKHLNVEGNAVIFDLEEESDGTRRLIDFIPFLHSIINKDKTYIIDEIERSIHPLLIKELVKKFADNPYTKGQLIFTTHESNLLDQSIFRQDEIWFAEKDQEGATDLYSLSDFKEHKTIDIQKGYLNGRYGSIPFLGDLKALNWEDYVVEQE